MDNKRMKQTALALLLIGAGYIVGAGAPTASAYTEDTTRLLNKITTELTGIRRSLDTIARKIK